MVSIVITAYNVGKWIGKAVESACIQTHDDIEIIVVEDHSSDNTGEILSNIRDGRIKVIYNPENLGAGASRRIGIDAAKGEYILLMDGDDWLDEGFIASLYRRAVETGADIVSGGVTIIHEDGSRKAFSYGKKSVEGKEKLAHFWKEDVVFMNNKLIHRTLHEKVPYCTRRYIEDTPVIIPMLYLANKVAYIDNTGYNYRQHSSSLTHTATPFKEALFRALCAEDLVSFFEKHDKEILKKEKLGKTYADCLYRIKECHPNANIIEPFKDEWIEYTAKLMERIGT